MENSKISWTDHTMNFWIGCNKVSAGCAHCYAEVDTFARKERAHGNELWGVNANRHRTAPANWRNPFKWNADEWFECHECDWRGSYKDAVLEHDIRMREEYYSCPKCESNDLRPTRQRIFVSSLSDICEDHPQILYNWRAEISRIVSACFNLDWLFLTKRPENFNRLWSQPHYSGKLPDNLWVGTTCENQEAADKRIPELLNINAKTRFLSCEPLLGTVSLIGSNNPYFFKSPAEMRESIHWVIAGGESGSKARPMHPQWARSLRDQCAEAGIPFHFKQFGSWAPWNMDMGSINAYDNAYADRSGVFSEIPSGHHVTLCRVGKKASGHLLDGNEYLEFPKR